MPAWHPHTHTHTHVPPHLHLPHPQVGYLGLSMLGSWLILRWALKQMDPNRSAKQTAKERRKQLEKRLGRAVKLDGAYEDVSSSGGGGGGGGIFLLRFGWWCCRGLWSPKKQDVEGRA